MIYKNKTTIPLLLLLVSYVATADTDTLKVNTTPLFSDHHVLQIRLEADFANMCLERRVRNCDYIPSKLDYWYEGEQPKSIPVKIKIRGGWRAQRHHCNVHPLFIRFADDSTRGTPFAGQLMLPLSTHCNEDNVNGTSDVSSAEYEQYVLLEYLSYRIYNLLSETSLQIKLAQVQYIDGRTEPDRKKSPSRYAFFVEHFQSLAKRKHYELLPAGRFDHQLIDPLVMDLVGLFQFMIGNTDTSIVRQRNTILLADGNNKQFTVPYDFDMAGLVNSHYADPAPTLPIKTVRHRHYLGFCHANNDWPALVEIFTNNKQRILQEVQNIPNLTAKNRRYTTAYINEFYAILTSAAGRKRFITDRCKAWPPSPIDHTTPPATVIKPETR